jgi:DNA polymerase bacteriophage-type
MPASHTIRGVVFDVETFSRCELDVSGSDVYSRNLSTDVLCAAWILVEADGVPTPGRLPGSWIPGNPPPAWAFDDCDVWAWNVDFDRRIYDRVLVPRYGWPVRPVNRWRCLMARAAYGNLPLKLAMAGKVLAAEELKDNEGHRLMMRLAKPAKPTIKSDNERRFHTPGALEALAAYCRQDAVAEAALLRFLPELPPMEEEAFALDRVINDRGVAVDLNLVRRLRSLAADLADLQRESLCEVTGGRVEKETKLPAFADWLRDQGVAVSVGKGAMDKEAVGVYLAGVHARLADDPTDEAARLAAKALRLRQALGRSSFAKFDALLAGTGPDGRLRGAVQYGGAHQTLRWAGRLVQTQNMPKGILGSNPEKGPTYEAARALVLDGDAPCLPLLLSLYGEGVEELTPEERAAGQTPGLPAVLASLLRTCFVAPPGKVLGVADYAAVEARGVFWLADDVAGLGAFASGADIYSLAASAIMGRPITKADKERNKLGKPTVLGSGYGMGPAKFADTFDMDEATSSKAIQAYRTTFVGVPALWKAVERAAVAACRNPGQAVACSRGRVMFKHNGRHLFCRLPSGRVLTYRDARLVPGRFEGTTVVEFAYEDLTTKQWVRGTTWGGSFVENIVQALCRDLLLHAMHELEREGMPVVLHVHDEVVCELDPPPDRVAAKALVKRLESVLCRLPAWAAGFPAAAEGFLSDYWHK